MKNTVLLICLFFFVKTAAAQTVSNDDFRSLIPFMQKEDYKSAFKASDKILNATVNDSSNLRGIVTYMNLLASAGMVSKGEMKYDDFEKNAKKYIGHYVVMSAHPCIDSTKMAYNSVKLQPDETGKVKGTVATTNQAATRILFFEYFDFEQPVDPSDYVGKNVRCGGILEDHKPNPNKTTVVVGRMYIKHAFINEMTPR
ncbi:MAG: hypothetical protein WBP58_15145 [Chitinophagaceae bacterium]